MRGCGIEIDFGAAVIEVDRDVWIAQRGFDYGRVERRATDGIDVLPRVAIVGRKVELASRACGMNHPAGHGDGVLENFIRDAELLERMNPARRERQVDRAAGHEIPRARIGPALVELDEMAAPTQISGEQATGEPATD